MPSRDRRSPALRPEFRATLVLAALACGAASGCRSAETGTTTVSGAGPGDAPPAKRAEATARRVELPDAWDAWGRFAFERWLASAFEHPRPATLRPADVETLRAALAGFDERAVRAALILVHADASERAREALIARLEARAVAPDRPSDAADVVAAAGFATRADGPAVAGRLARLALGPEPHPDLEVRVECAASALWLGRRDVIPFLLRVLRELTPAAKGDPPDWEPKTTMAWSKSRAAEALSLAAGVPRTYRPDAPVADQMREADRLERALTR